MRELLIEQLAESMWRLWCHEYHGDHTLLWSSVLAKNQWRINAEKCLGLLQPPPVFSVDVISHD